MKRSTILLIIFLVFNMGYSQTKICITADNKTRTATLVNNSATQKLVSLLSEGPITIQMSEYGGFEMVGALPQSLPTSNSNITTAPGDIMLYLGQNIVIFYGTNSWSYTRLGKIDDATAENIKEFLGSGGVSVTLSLNPGTGDIATTKTDKPDSETIYDIQGRHLVKQPTSKGVYIINGEKKVIK